MRINSVEKLFSLVHGGKIVGYRLYFVWRSPGVGRGARERKSVVDITAQVADSIPSLSYLTVTGVIRLVAGENGLLASSEELAAGRYVKDGSSDKVFLEAFRAYCDEHSKTYYAGAEFNKEKMLRFVEKDRFIKFMYSDMCKRRGDNLSEDEKTRILEVIYNSEIAEDSAMLESYRNT